MKKLFPIALMMCMVFSLSGFAHENLPSPLVKKSSMVTTWPVTGEWFQYTYEITGITNTTGDIPWSISLYNNGTLLGVYPFSFINNGPGGTSFYEGQGMGTVTNGNIVVVRWFSVNQIQFIGNI